MPRMHAELQAQGTRVGRQRVARLMRQAQLAGRTRRAHRVTTTPDLPATIPDLVQRHFTTPRITTLWFADITSVPTDEGWVYVASLLDACSRRIVGWALADHLRTELATEALTMALAHRKPDAGLIHHSDRGCQYTSRAYGEVLASSRAFRSVGSPGVCWDNAVAESFFATLKTERIHRHRWPTRQAATTAIFEYIEAFYNRTRLHSGLGYLSPNAFERSLAHTTLAA